MGRTEVPQKMQVSIHITTQMLTPEIKEAQKSIQTMHSHICLNIPLTVRNNHCMAHFQQKLVRNIEEILQDNIKNITQLLNKNFHH